MKKIIAIITSAVFISSVIALAGCEGRSSKTNNSNGYQKKLTYWAPIESSISSVVSDRGKTPLSKELEKRLGIEVDFIHPALGQESEKFNIILASNDMPDIIQYRWSYYAGGPAKAIKDGRIVPLDDSKQYAPNIYSYLNSNKEKKKMYTTNEGVLYAFPCPIQGSSELAVSAGMIIRQDWLNELGLSIPETVDEWEQALTAFKDKKGASEALSLNTSAFKNGVFVGAFDTTYGYYKKDGKVCYGLMDSGFKDFLIKMNEWYKKGLISQNIASIDQQTITSNMLTGVAGATYGAVGSGIGRLTASATQTGYKLIGTPYPVLKRGEKCNFSQLSSDVIAAAVTTNCKDIKTAFKYLDYGYSEEGSLVNCFGIEGLSYNMVDGYPTYTELITKNPDGLSMSEVLGLYTLASTSGPNIQDMRYMEQYAALPEQKQSWKTWADTNAMSHILPTIYSEQEELNDYARYKNDVDSYAGEMILKFIIGAENFDKYDLFINTLKSRGADKLLEIIQKSVDKYNTKQ